MPEPLVQFQPQGRKVPSRVGRTLLELSSEAGLSIESICGGVGVCAKCKVIVRSGIGHVTPVTSSEKDALEPLELAAGMRLACQATVCGEAPIVVEVPQASQRGHHR